MEIAHPFIGQPDHETRLARVFDLGYRRHPLKEAFRRRPRLRGIPLDAQSEPFAEREVQSHFALIQALERRLKARQAKIGVKHRQSAGDLVGIGKNAGRVAPVCYPDFQPLGKSSEQRIRIFNTLVSAFGRLPGGGGFGRFVRLRRMGEIDREHRGDAYAVAQQAVIEACCPGNLIAPKYRRSGLFE